MEKKRRAVLVKIVAVILVMALIAPTSVSAAMPEAVMPMASDYLMGYTAYVCAMGGGKLEIWFEVTGTGFQEYLGALSVRLYESTDNVNWYLVETFLHNNYSQMLATNAWQHINHVDYEGVAGRYYKAYVGIWGGPDDTGDARYIWTPVERAT